MRTDTENNATPKGRFACLVRMTEILPNPVILSTDADFRIYRRHSRQVVPCLLP